MTASGMRKLKKRIRVSPFAVGINMGNPVSGKDSKQEPITCTDLHRLGKTPRFFLSSDVALFLHPWQHPKCRTLKSKIRPLSGKLRHS